jgi:olefin beta-lactone synthetase
MTANIAETFAAVARQWGKKPAVIEERSGKSITFADLNERAERFAALFTAAGVQPGEVVMLMVRPSIDFICLTLALFKIGAPVVLIDPGMGYRNLLGCVARVAPRYLVGIPAAILFAKIFRRPFRQVRRFFCCGRAGGLFGGDIRRQLPADAGSTRTYAAAPEELAAIIFTTGSTGPPKGVRYEHRVFAAQLRLIKEYYRIGPEDIDQPAFPLFALFSAAAGACSVIPDMDPSRPAAVDPEIFVDSIRRHRVSYSFGSPAIWNVVSRYCLSAGIVLQSVDKVLLAGAPVPYELLQRVRAILPERAEVFTPYGATESLPIVSIESREVLAETWRLSRDGAGTCVGRPLPGIRIAIIPIVERVVAELAETSMLPPGEKGEIIVTGPVVTSGYQNNPEATALAKIRDGNGFWHRMGDVGYLDEQGRLWFCGRLAHRVETVEGILFSIPCEAIVNEHPDVFRSALVGITPDQAGRKRPVLVIEVEKKMGVKPRRVLAEVRELAGRHPLTRGIEHFLLHDSFPVDIRHNAKIFREKLAIWAEGKISR